MSNHLGFSSVSTLALTFGTFAIKYPFALEEFKIKNWVIAKLNKKPKMKGLKNQKTMDRIKKKRLTILVRFP